MSPLEKHFKTFNFGFLSFDFPLIHSLLDWTSVNTQVDLRQVEQFRYQHRHIYNRLPQGSSIG